MTCTKPHCLRSCVAAALALAIALIVGACGGNQPDSKQTAGCNMLSTKTLESLFEHTHLKSSGDLLTKAERRKTPAQCEVSDKDTGKLLLLVTVSDSQDPADAQRQQDMVAKEASALHGCQTQGTLPQGGYVCVDGKELVAATAVSDRLIRLTIPGEAGRSLSVEQVAGIITEINESASATQEGA